MSHEQPSYRMRFHTAAEAMSYEENEYSPVGYPALLWQLEQDILQTVLVDVRSGTSGIDYLDFACGTGRVLSFMESRVDRSTGVDISETMLEVAAGKVRDSRLIKLDITADAEDELGPFDLITTFRFVLNAEPDLRRMALCRLAGLLRDDQSLLVFNNHINLWSYKLGTWPKQRMASSGRQSLYRPNFLTNRAVRRLAQDCGLAVQGSYGFGYLSRRALSVVGYDRLLCAERRLAGMRVLNPFGVDQIFVARRIPSTVHR